MLQRSRKCYFSGRMLFSVAMTSLCLNAVQASSLNTIRLGVSPQKTRLVFELDRTTPYQVDFNDSTVQVSFDALTVQPEVVNNFQKGLGGLLDQIRYESDEGKTTFTLSVKNHFYLRYFDLVSPTRVVVDFYPREEEPGLAKTTQTPIVSPPEPLNEASVQEPASQEPAATTAATPAEPSGTPDSQTAAGALEETITEQTLTATEAGSASETPAQPVKGAAKSNPNRNRTKILFFGALGIVGLLVVSVLILRRKPVKKEKAGIHQEIESEPPSVPEMHIEFAESETVADAQPQYQSTHERSIVEERQPEWEEEPVRQTEFPSLESNISELDLRSTKEELFVRHENAAEWKEPESGDAPEPITAEPAVESKSEKEVVDPIPDEQELPPKILTTDEENEVAFQLEESPISEGIIVEEQSVTSMEPAAEAPIPQHPINLEHALPELRIEDGILIWPVHLLDGGRSGRILVVDDEADIVKPIEEYLTTQGYEVLSSTNSTAALEKYADWHPDLIILDVSMPKLSGVDFVKEIRKEDKNRKVIFLSGKTERDTVEAAFAPELQNGLYEFFKKPVLLEQIGGRVKDYFLSAQEVLHLNLTDQISFSETIEHLSPHQLVALHGFLWDRIFEVSAELLGRRIEPFFITDRMEPATEYMRRMGCQERRDYCIARVCIVSNPLCASNRLRAELEIMRQILHEFREEYLARLHRGATLEEPEAPAPRKKRAPRKSRKKELVEAEGGAAIPPRKTVKRNVTSRKR